LNISFSAQNDPVYTYKPDNREVVINYKLINSLNITVVNSSFPSFITKFASMQSYSLKNTHYDAQLPPDTYTISFDVNPSTDILYKNISVSITTDTITKLPSNINMFDGWIFGSTFDEGGPSNGDPEKCRQLANAGNGKYIAWGHRNNTHPDRNARDTCFLYKTIPESKSLLDQEYHSTGCLTSGQNASKGCISQITFGDVNNPVFINTPAMHKGSGGNIGTLPFTVGNGTKVFTFTYTPVSIDASITYVRTRINFYGPKPYEIYREFNPVNGNFILTDTVDNTKLPAGTYSLNIYVDYGEMFAIECTIKNV